jgi:hypothetical protein
MDDMATVIAQTRKLSGFFSGLAQRLYDARLDLAKREVDQHRKFLGIMPF